MSGQVELSDSVIVAAAEGSDWARAQLLEVLTPQVRLMVRARLAPTPNQLFAVDELVDQVLMGVVGGVGRLENRTATGMKSFLSRIVRNKVADFIREARAPGRRLAIQSLDTTVADLSQVGPMWQFLSASGMSPRTALDHAECLSRLMDELGRLEAAEREALVLTFFDRLTVAEMAEQMQLTRAAAAKLVVRGLRTLQQALR
jgi:RNA polymerase sigma factor (sigma-70 family)